MTFPSLDRDKMGTNRTRLGEACAFLCFLCVPFLGGNDLPLHYLVVDRFWIETLFGVLLILSIAFLYLEGQRGQQGFLGFMVYFLPYFGLTALSLIYSWSRFNTMTSLAILVWAAGSVYLFFLCPRKEVCLAGLTAGATMCAVAAILQHEVLFPNLVTVFQQGLYAHILKEQSGIPFASYSYHNILGGYLAALFPIAIYFAVHKRAVSGLVGIAASALIVTGVVLTSTRIGLGIVGLCLGATLGFLLASRNRSGFIKIAAMVGVTLLVVSWVLHGGGVKGGVGVQNVIAHKAKTAYSHLSTMNTRTDIWKNAFSAFRHQPVAGSGGGSFELAYRRYFDGGSYTAVAHSIVVKTIVELGVIGLACFCFYLWGVFAHIRRKPKTPFPLFVLLSLCSVLLFGLLDFSFDVASHVISFFVLSSFFFIRETPTSHGAHPKDRSNREIALFTGVVVLLLATFLFNVRFEMFKKGVANGDLLQENGLSIPALYSYREAMDSMPLSSEAYVKASAVLIQLSNTETNENTKKAMIHELTEYVRMLEHRRDRNSERYFSLGASYAFLGDRNKADFYFRRAMLYYPSSPRYTYEIVGYYFAVGDYEAAMAYLNDFDPYVPKFRTPHNPRGIYLYRIRDLEVSIEYQRGNRVGALKLARANLKDAQDGVYVITSARSRSFVEREAFLKYLQQRVTLFEGRQ
jgi:O-antigen ligase